MRPWIPQHPNFALYVDSNKPLCNCCGSDQLEEWHNHAYTNLSKFKLYRCNGCGTFKRGRENLLSKEKMQSNLMNVN
jgi:hypothetical protein